MLGACGTAIKGQMRQKPKQWRTWRTSQSGWFCDHTKPNCVDLPGLSTFSSGVKMTVSTLSQDHEFHPTTKPHVHSTVEGGSTCRTGGTFLGVCTFLMMRAATR